MPPVPISKEVMPSQTPTVESAGNELEAEFERLNSLAKVEVEAEQVRVKNAFSEAYREAERTGKYVDALSPGMVMARGKLPTPVSKGFSAGVAAGMMPKMRESPVLYGLVFGAVGHLALGISEVMAGPPEARGVAFKKLVKDACVAAVTSGATVLLAKRLEQWLIKNASRILAVLGNREAAEKLAFNCANDAMKVSATCGTLLHGAFLAITALWHGAMSAWAKCNRDMETSNMEWEKAKDALKVDNLIRSFVSAVSGFIIATTVAPVVGTGFLGFMVPCLAYFVSQWMLEQVISRKGRSGGWSQWLASWFIEYRGAHVWSGGDFDLYESQITQQLECCISLGIVVDPVRSIRTGAIFERANLYAWLSEHGTDPLTRERTTKLDYIDAPIAKEHAAKLASFLGASAIRSP